MRPIYPSWFKIEAICGANKWIPVAIEIPTRQIDFRNITILLKLISFTHSRW